MRNLILSLTVLFLSQTFAANYKLDTSHGQVGFKVKHLMVSNVEGKFKEFEGAFDFDEKTSALENTNVTVKMQSIDTTEPKRDEHLKGEDFFDVSKNPTMTFKQTKKVVLKKDKVTDVPGELTIKGVTKPVTLKVTYNGAVTDPWGNRKVGFDAKTTVKRKDFGVSWNKNLDGGGVVVGEDVNVLLSGEATAQAAAK
jgi:polyisoprenoid-binding protein YceI